MNAMPWMCMQYWLGSSEDNIEAMVRFLISRYGSDDALRTIEAPEPIEYAEVGLHALEAKGLNVVPAFASGLDGRPAIEAYFRDRVDAVISLTGFSLVGGPAYNDSAAAEDILADLDVPYLAAHPLEFQTLDQWSRSGSGLGPVETTMLVALPELDGATNPTVFAGRHGALRRSPHARQSWSPCAAHPANPARSALCSSGSLPTQAPLELPPIWGSGRAFGTHSTR